LIPVIVALVFAFPFTLSAQDSDALILENSRPYTIVDEISDRAERAAFLEIYRARTPRDKAQKAEVFLARFPQSWLLAEVYEIAAKAYIDLGDFDRAVQDGRASLQILPESALLLTPLANVEAKLGLRTEAEQSAEDALNYLDRFSRPASIPEKGWPDLQRELKASCFFVLGRVGTVEAKYPRRDADSLYPIEIFYVHLLEGFRYKKNLSSAGGKVASDKSREVALRGFCGVTESPWTI
jgi:tetratricopeptide (TPR) repeat protein